jgi:rhodanese-related sulfurtransferase
VCWRQGAEGERRPPLRPRPSRPSHRRRRQIYWPLLDFYSASFATDLAALNGDVPYLIYCHTGNRSGQTREMMRQLGFERVYDLQGGIAAWQAAGQPITP